MRALLFAFIFGCLVAPLTSFAAEGNEKFREVPPPPPAGTIPIPDEGDDEDTASSEPEPEVTIVQRKDAKLEEYRLNGRLYMVKIVPFIGPPYYLVDRDGDGLMESRINGRGAEPRAPQWTILSW
jgi:Protein of unknown function (DUF2782)